MAIAWEDLGVLYWWDTDQLVDFWNGRLIASTASSSTSRLSREAPFVVWLFTGLHFLYVVLLGVESANGSSMIRGASAFKIYRRVGILANLGWVRARAHPHPVSAIVWCLCGECTLTVGNSSRCASID